MEPDPEPTINKGAYLTLVETFPDGAVLFDYCNRFGFEGPRKPELTEAQKTLARKRQQLARVIERLRSPPLSHGIARELRKQQAILEREIAELE